MILSLPTVPLFGQAANSPVAFANNDAITTTLVQATNIGQSSGGSSSGDTKWLKVEIKYSVVLPPDAPKAAKYLDEVQFKIWIEGRDLLDPQSTNPDEGTAVGLTGSVTYVNVPAGRDVYGVFYVHPNALGRYSSSRGASDFDTSGKFDIHVEAYVGGKLMDRIDRKKGETDGWHLQLKAVPNLVYRQNQTPFLNVDVDRYPAIKLPDDSSK